MWIRIVEEPLDERGGAPGRGWARGPRDARRGSDCGLVRKKKVGARMQGVSGKNVAGVFSPPTISNLLF